MGRRSKYKRKEIKITKKWIEESCKPKITEKERKIIKYIYKNRLVRSDHIARLFWMGSNNAQSLANRKLRKLFDLYCVDRFFPYVEKGSSKQHLVLDKAGAKILGLRQFKKREKLPFTYRHMVLVTEFRLEAYFKGFGWGKLEKEIGGNKADVYYKNMNIAVEIDTGTEVYKTLQRKAGKYNMNYNLEGVIFVTAGDDKRVDVFLNLLGSHIKKAGCSFKDLNNFLDIFKG